MDRFSIQPYLNSHAKLDQTNGNSLNALDLHMILISFSPQKVSINCFPKSIQPVLMPYYV